MRSSDAASGGRRQSWWNPQPQSLDRPSNWKQALATEFRRLRPLLNLPLVVGSLILGGIVLLALFGPLWTPQDPYITAQATLPHFDVERGEMISPPFDPSREHLMGTDRFGNDVLSFVIHGARVTLVLGLVTTAGRVLLGLLLGSMAGWYEDSLWDRFVMGVSGVLGSIPMILAALILILALGVQRGPWVFVVGLVLTGWTELAQQVRGEMLVIRRQEYIEAAEAIGLTKMQQAVRHALPNVVPTLVVLFFLDMGLVLILMAELGFLGVFVGGGSFFVLDPFFGEGAFHQIEIPEWGALVAQGTPYIRSYPFLLIGPALAFFVTIIGFNSVGEGLRKAVERRPLSTGFLLSKRGLLFGVGIAIAVVFIIYQTGPKLSYERTAKELRGDRAAVIVSQLASQERAGGSSSEGVRGSSEFIRRSYQSLELGRGVRQSINSRYIHHVQVPLGPEGEELVVDVPMVAAFWPGYDQDLADELIILLAKFDGLEGSVAQTAGPAQAPPSGVGLMLELAQSWKEQSMDPRRSVMFIAWGGGNLGYAGIESYLSDARNFTRHPIPSRELVAPSVVVQLESSAEVAADEVRFRTDDARLHSILLGAGDRMGLTLWEDEPRPAPSYGTGVAQVELTFHSGICAPGVVADAECDTRQLEKIGETISLFGLKILRQPEY